MLAISGAVASIAWSALGERMHALELARGAIGHAARQRDHGSLNFALSAPMVALLDGASPELALACVRVLEEVGSANDIAVDVRTRAPDRAREALDAAAYTELSSRIDALSFDEAIDLVLAALDREIAALAT